jgi:hypothetical protein
MGILVAIFYDTNGNTIPLKSLILPPGECRPLRGEVISTKDGVRYEVVSSEWKEYQQKVVLFYTLHELINNN